MGLQEIKLKILYGPEVCGLHAACTEELLTNFVGIAPEYLKIIEGNAALDAFWANNKKNVDYGCININGTIYCLDITWENDFGRALRIDPKVIDMFEKYGNKGTQFRTYFKIADVPDDMEWEVYISDVDGESIHEKHRSWN